MADSILRLKVESAEYDSKLKKASQGLQHYIDECRKAGGTLTVVEDDTLAFVKALGGMPTVAQGGTQSLREMTRSLTDLTMQYRSLTDEEKNSPFGQAMATSIQTLTERAGQARDAMDDVQATIKHAASDTRVFDQIAGAAGLATASFQTLQGASKLLGVDLGDNVEVIAKLQAAMAVTNGLTQIQTALQKESALMQGIQTIQTKALAAAQALNATNTTAATVAQGAFNAVAKANPYVLLASAVLAVGTAIFAYTRHTKEATEETQRSEAAMKRARAAADSYRKSMSSNFADMMGKYESLKRAWLSLADTHQKQQWINDNKKAFEELGLSINTVKSAEDVFEANTGKVVDSFRRRAQSAALAARMVDLYQQKMDLELQAKELYNDKKVSAYDVVGNRVTGSFTRDAGADTFNEGRYGLNNQGQYYFTAKGAKEYNQQLFTSNKQLKDMNDRYKELNGQIDETNRELTQLESTVTTIKDKTPIIPAGSIADLTQKLQDLKTAQSLVTKTDDWVRYQQQIKNVEYQINALKGEWERGLQATFNLGGNNQFTKMADYLSTGQLDGLKLNDTIKVTVDDTEALSKLSEIQGVTIADKTVMVSAHNAAALEQLSQVQGISLDDKSISVTVNSAEAYNDMLQLSKDFDGTTVTFNVTPEIDRAIGKSITTSAGLNKYISGLKKQLQDADFGSDLYQSLTEKLADVTMLENLVKEALSVGLGTALFDIADEAGQDFWDRVISPEGVENADWQAIADAINRKRKELGLDAITLDFKTGSVGKGPSIESSDTIQKMTSGMSQVSSGLTQLGVKLPDGVNKLVSSMQGMTSIIQGVQTLLSVFGSSTMSVEIASQNANTSALMANTSALIANSASNNTDAVIEGVKGVMGMFSGGAAGKHNGGIIHAATGAIVPGRQFSGDNIPALLDSGELILNRAQQGNLASQLEGGGNETSTPLRPYVSGQYIFLGTNNYLRGAGLGEIVTTRMLQRMGLM